MSAECSVCTAASYFEIADTKQWYEALTQACKEIEIDLSWNEASDQAVNQTIDEEALFALSLCAAYLDEGKEPPAKLKSTWDEDKTYLAAMKNKKAKFRYFYQDIDCLLPADFNFSFVFADINAEEMVYASLFEFERQQETIQKQLTGKSNPCIDLAKQAILFYTELIQMAKSEKLPLWIG